jgi:hypothetical protein
MVPDVVERARAADLDIAVTRRQEMQSRHGRSG